MSSFTLCRLVSGLLLAALAVSAQAAQVTATTSFVQGNAPRVIGEVVIVNLSRPGLAPVLGDTVGVEYVFFDDDGDAEKDTIINWFSDDGIEGGGSSVLIKRKGEYFVSVKPRSDCTITMPCQRADFFSSKPITIDR